MSIHLILACHLQSHLLNWEPHPATAAGAETQVVNWEGTDCAQGRGGDMLEVHMVLRARPMDCKHLDTLPTILPSQSKGRSPVPRAQFQGHRYRPSAKQS